MMGPLWLESPDFMCSHWDCFTLFVTYKTYYLSIYLSISDGILSQYSKIKRTFQPEHDSTFFISIGNIKKTCPEGIKNSCP